MIPNVKEIRRQVESWLEEDQEELAHVIQLIEARRTGVCRLSDEERSAVRAGMDAVRRGEFAPEDEMERFYQLHRIA